MTNYIPADGKFRCHESITIAAHGDFLFLDNVVPAIERWKGPISLTVYAPGDDFYEALESIAYLRNCQTPLVRELVTFHIIFNMGHQPNQVRNFIVTNF